VRALLPLLLVGCASGPTIHEVHEGFARDVRELRPALPTSGDIRPLRAADDEPMARTVDLCERFLAARGGRSIDRDHCAALLACAYVTRGRVTEARAITRRLVVPGVSAPERERATIERARWLTAAARLAQARSALDRMIETEEGEVAFVEEFGPLAGYPLPRTTDGDYLRVLEKHTLELRAVLFPPEPRSPRDLDARLLRIRELRRTLAELFYDDAAALKSALERAPPQPADASDEFFSMALSSLFVTVAYLTDDLVPRVPMVEAQKQWMREQSLTTYEAVRALARLYVPERRMRDLETGLLPKPAATPTECRERLYARLFIAQQEALAWITLRGE